MCLTMEAHGIKTVVLLEMLFLIFIKGRHICFVIFGTRDNTVNKCLYFVFLEYCHL